MENERMIALQNICNHYNIEVSFIQSLNEYGLIEIIKVEETECIDEEQLGDFERILHLHFDLDINLAGIEAISHLLNRVHDMQVEMNLLRNKLGRF